MANFAVTPNQALDTLNYIISGTPAIGQTGNAISESNSVYVNNTGFPPYVVDTPVTGGFPQDEQIYTDLNSTVTVTRPQDQVLVSSQCRTFVNWTADNINDVLEIDGNLWRYDQDGNGTLLAYRPITLTATAAATPIDVFLGDFIYQTLIDSPGIGIWEYSFTFEIVSAYTSANAVLNQIEPDIRSINANIIKP